MKTEVNGCKGKVKGESGEKKTGILHNYCEKYSYRIEL